MSSLSEKLMSSIVIFDGAMGTELFYGPVGDNSRQNPSDLTDILQHISMKGFTPEVDRRSFTKQIKSS